MSSRTDLPNLKSRTESSASEHNNGNVMEPTNPATSEIVFSTPPNSPPVGLLVDLASPTVTSKDTFTPLEDAPEPFMTPLSNTPSPPSSSPLPISLKYSEVETRRSDVVKGRPRTWYGGSVNISTAQDEELRRSNSLEDFAKALASVSDDESLASATSEANSKEGLLNTMCSFMQKESRTASFVSSTSDISVEKESVESDVESQHGDDCKHEFTQEDIKREDVKNIDECQGIQEYTSGSSKEYEEIENVDNLDRDEVNVLGGGEVHLGSRINSENGMHGIIEGHKDVYNENTDEKKKLGTREDLCKSWTMETMNDNTADSNVENNGDENKCKDAVHECRDSEHESGNQERERGDMEHECGQTDKFNHSNTELQSGDTEHKSKDTEEKCKDTQEKCKDTVEECKNTVEESKDTEKKSRDTGEESMSTEKKYKGIEKECNDTEEKIKFRDKNEKIEETTETWQDTLTKQESERNIDPESLSDTEATANHGITEESLRREGEQENLQNLDSKPYENTHNYENDVETSVVCNVVNGDAEEPESMVENVYLENKDEENENVRRENVEEMRDSEQRELSNDNEELKLKAEDQYKKPLDDTVDSDIGIPEVTEDQPREKQLMHEDKPVENLSEEVELSQASYDSEIVEENRCDKITSNGPERNETSPEGDEVETKDLKKSSGSIIPEEKCKNLSIQSGNVAEEFKDNSKVAQDRGEHSESCPTEPDVRVNDPEIGPDDGEDNDNSNVYQTKIKYEDLNDIECEVIDFCLPGQNTERNAELFRIQATHDVESGDDSDQDKHIHLDEKARSVMPPAEERSPTNLEETFSGLAFRQRSGLLLGVKTPVKRSGSDVSVTSLQDVHFDMNVNNRDGDLSPGSLNSSRKAKSFGDLSTFPDSHADTTNDDGGDSEDERKRIREDHSVRLYFNTRVLIIVLIFKLAIVFDSIGSHSYPF